MRPVGIVAQEIGENYRYRWGTHECASGSWSFDSEWDPWRDSVSAEVEYSMSGIGTKTNGIASKTVEIQGRTKF